MASVFVTQDRVTAPPDRFIDVSDRALVRFFQGVFSPQQEDQVAILHQLMLGISAQDFADLRRRLEGEFEFFACAAAGKKSRVKIGSWKEVDDQEMQFLGDFWEVMQAGHFKFLGRQEWESALSEDFMFTLPVSVGYKAMDEGLLKRFWGQAGRGAQRDSAPAELADRCLVFYRGVSLARMRGSYFSMKLDYLIAFFIFEPFWRALAYLLRLVGLTPPRWIAAGVLPESAQPWQHREGQQAKHAQHAQHAAEVEGQDPHQHSISVERRTFARVFPNGRAVLRQLFKKVDLQEACFKDVVVLYRRAVKGEKNGGGEMDIIDDVDTSVASRNITIKHFRSIPLADLELVLPDKTVLVPPMVLLQLLVTLIVGLVAALGALKQGSLNLSVLWSAVVVLGTRAMQVYTSAQSTRTTIERNMSKMLYERTAASQEAVLQTLTEEMSKQRVRELFVCYCVLRHSQAVLSATQLDGKCERFLSRQFGLTIDFTAEKALPTLEQWGLVTRTGNDELQAKPLGSALAALDAVWDGLYDFEEGKEGEMSSSAGVLPQGSIKGGGLFSFASTRGGVTSMFSSPSERAKKQAQQAQQAQREDTASSAAGAQRQVPAPAGVSSRSVSSTPAVPAVPPPSQPRASHSSSPLAPAGADVANGNEHHEHDGGVKKKKKGVMTKIKAAFSG